VLASVSTNLNFRLWTTVFKHPVALLHFTHDNYFRQNATIYSFTLPHHNMFRPLLAIIRYSYFAKTVILKSKTKLCYDWRSVGQSILVSSTHLGLMTRFLLLSDNCGFVDVGRSLWQENGSAIYNCCWSSPAQSFLGPSPMGLVTVFYCLRFETPPNGGSGPRIYIVTCILVTATGFGLVIGFIDHSQVVTTITHNYL
jgi:hypothetical protein